MAEDSRRDWLSDLEMDDHDNYWPDNSLDEEFLGDILQQQQDLTVPAAVTTSATATVGSLLFEQTNLHVMSSSDSSLVSQHAWEKPASSPKTYILSFENATASLPSIHDPCSASEEVYRSQLGSHGTYSLPLSSSRASQGTKKDRSASETLDHIMSERKRRQELTKKFIALSAIIPGLKKMDKAHVLKEAIDYMKQLQERVKELEEDIKESSGESGITISRSHLYIDEGTTLCEMNSGGCHGPNETLPDVEASVLGKDVLIKIHCGKQKGILLKLLSQLESLHLSIASSKVLPFGNTLDITIIAQMGDKYSMIVKDLVKYLRLAILKSCDVQQ